jgi:DNA-binding winged helix-turn-helix (wHTH) protein/tetratricopeptide (TPR) repeat protein
MTHDVLLFGDCSIQIASRELLRDGKRVNVSPTVFDCLAYLIEHRDRAVGRDELVAAVWGKTSVSDAVMGKTILTARRAIGDTAEEQRYLRTVPRFGYLWDAETRTAEDPSHEPVAAAVVEPADSSTNATSEPTAKAPPPFRARLRRRPVALMAAAVALLLVLALGLREIRRATQTAALEPASIVSGELTVVLPVEVIGEAGDEWMRLGLMDLVATRLRNAGLSVLPSDSVVRLVPAGTERDAAIATVRGVAERNQLVLPIVRRSGADWIVRADLLEPDGSVHTVEAQTDNVITAAGGAADRLLELLGKRAPGNVMNTAQLSQAELLQRVDAARLAGDPEQARSLIGAADPVIQKAPEVQLRLAQIDLRIGQFKAAHERLDELVGQVSAEADPSLHARLQSYRCIALARVGQLDAAVGACDEAIALLESREQPGELGRVYSDRGIVRLLQGQYDLAGKDFARARVALNLAGDVLQLAKVEGNESTLDMAQGHYTEVVEIQQRIGTRFERFGMGNERVASLNNQTAAHLALLQPRDALKTSDEALTRLDRVTDASIRYSTKLQRADTLEANGRLGEARILLDEVIGEASAEQYAPERATARASEARLDLIGGQPAAALLLARQAISSLPAPPYGSVRAGAWLSALRSLHRLGRAEEGAAELRSFAAWARTEGDPVVALYLQLGAAEQAAAEHHEVDAQPRYAEALAAAKRWGVPDALSETVASYGRFLLDMGELQQASIVIGLVARYADADFDSAVLQAQLYRALGQQQAAQTALAQARRLAGERPLPTDLSNAAPPSSSIAPIGNSAATRWEHKRNSPDIVARLPAD